MKHAILLMLFSTLAAHAAEPARKGPAKMNAEIRLNHVTNESEKPLVVVDLLIPNPGKSPLQLDGLSVCEDGEIKNWVFKVTADGRDLPYQGMLKERVAPEHFFQVPPGYTYAAKVDLSDAFPFPKAAKEITVRYETNNHFSPDEVYFESNVLKFNYATHPGEEVIFPAKLKLVHAQKGKGKPSIVVELSIPNAGPRPVLLDPLSVASRGEIQNHFFLVSIGGKDLPYQGMMKKRVSPQNFVTVQPGETYRKEVELGENYAFPPTAKAVSVRFETFNHFSPDAILLKSDPITFSY